MNKAKKKDSVHRKNTTRSSKKNDNQIQNEKSNQRVIKARTPTTATSTFTCSAEPITAANVSKKEKKKTKRDRKKDKESRSIEIDEENGGTPKKKKPTWVGMEAAKEFFEKFSDLTILKKEYSFLQSVNCNKPATVAQKYMERNRTKSNLALDENRVVLNRPGPDQINYINASLITVKDVPNKIIVAQLPEMENESFIEDFWQMVYQENITILYLLCTSDEVSKTPTQLFCTESGAFQYVGKMFINNRKTEDCADRLRKYTIEILPEGCSDSVITQVHHIQTWERGTQPVKLRHVIKMVHGFLSEKDVQNSAICAVSLTGLGRACTFLGALISISQLNKAVMPKILDIMINIKLQRPGAVETIMQYFAIYQIVLEYIRRKINDKEFTLKVASFLKTLKEISPPTSPP